MDNIVDKKISSPITFQYWLKLLKQYVTYKKHRSYNERTISHLQM